MTLIVKYNDHAVFCFIKGAHTMAENELVSVLKNLHLTETSAIQMVKTNEDYVLDLAAQSR